MKTDDKAGFAKLLAGVMAGYGKPLPDRSMVGVWFDLLTPFAPQAIAAAFAAYSADQPDFPPTPNGIAARARLVDGRPGAEEAFALALTTLDEQITVVWTQECAEAFAKARPVLDSSGAISARKTFAEIYDRLVVAARMRGQPVHWFTSPGLDKIGYAAAIKRATVSGLLPAPAPMRQLEAPEGETISRSPREQLDYLYDAIAKGAAEKLARLERASQERIGEEMALDIEIQAKVDQHAGDAQ